MPTEVGEDGPAPLVTEETQAVTRPPPPRVGRDEGQQRRRARRAGPPPHNARLHWEGRARTDGERPCQPFPLPSRQFAMHFKIENVYAL